MKKMLTYSTGLIALYLALSHATGGGSLLKDGASGAIGLVKTFQGR